jgi:4-amino-4-deoxy-L-arabinose transferase-like glycosyltransferase
VRRVPRAAWACALIASLSAACWSVITPPFQVPDEPSHFAYVQLLAETGHLPESSRDDFSFEERAILSGLHHGKVEWHPEVHTITSVRAQRELQEELTADLPRAGAGAGVAASEPPLYYALQTVPYFLGSSGTLLDQLELMRLLSALLAGVTALFTFMFVRECIPGVPWAWSVGGLGAALVPVLGFTSGAVTPDAGLYAVSATIFYCLARAFRRGLTRRLAIVLGALIAIAILTKLDFLGLLPGVVLGLVILGFRGEREDRAPRTRRRAFDATAIALAFAAAPLCAYLVYNLSVGRSPLGLVSGTSHAGKPGSLLGDAVYAWELYLPRLPGMVNHFPGLSTIRQLWFDRAVGLYGWLDTPMPSWLENLALIPAAVIALLCLRTLIVGRARLRARLSELAVYIVMSLGLMALIAQASRVDLVTAGAGWAQPRYLLPLLPLGAVVLALAGRGAGRRWGPAAGALIVVLFLAQDLFSQLQVVARFYG